MWEDNFVVPYSWNAATGQRRNPYFWSQARHCRVRYSWKTCGIHASGM